MNHAAARGLEYGRNYINVENKGEVKTLFCNLANELITTYYAK